MKRLLLIFFASFVVAGTSGCAGTLAPMDAYNIIPHKGVPEPSQGNAVVCYYRIWRFGGGGATFYVFKDDEAVGVAHRGTYFCHETSPGTYSYYVEWGGATGGKDRTSTLIRAEANQQYFISFDVMKEVSKSLALKEMEGMEYVEMVKLPEFTVNKD
jgi:hypothetical protein